MWKNHNIEHSIKNELIKELITNGYNEEELNQLSIEELKYKLALKQLVHPS